MLASQRQGYILQEVGQQGAARIADLAEVLSVSEMTIRRDIDSLAERGMLEKVHGGATAIIDGSNASEPPFTAKSLREQEIKDSIAAKAAELVKPGIAIALMGGSTVFAMARHIANIPRLTIITNSIPVSNYLQSEGRQDQTVILTGGQRTPTDSFVGPITKKILDEFNFDLAFLGSHGMDIEGGFSSPNILEAETNKSMRGRTKQLVFLCDHTKWGLIGLSTFAKLEDADILVTDNGYTDEVLAEIKTRVKQVIVTSVNPTIPITQAVEQLHD